jgi:hypothetical protein
MNLELEILKILDSAHPRMLKRAVLEGEARLAVDELTATAFDGALSKLDGKRQVRIHDGEDVSRVAITDAGRERVAAAR